MYSAVTFCSRMMSRISTPSKLPVRPRNVFGPSSCLAGSTLKSRSSSIQPVKARAASRMSFSGVVADPHGEEFHHLAGEILVGGALHVLGGIEIGEHRRAARHLDQQRAEIAGGMRDAAAPAAAPSCGSRGSSPRRWRNGRARTAPSSLPADGWWRPCGRPTNGRDAASPAWWRAASRRSGRPPAAAAVRPPA